MTTETRKEPAAGAQATYRHEDATDYDAAWIRPRCSCGWADLRHADSRVEIARRAWLEHAVAAYQAEEAVWCVGLAEEYERPAFHWQPDDDLADAEALAGDPVAGAEVREC